MAKTLDDLDEKLEELTNQIAETNRLLTLLMVRKLSLEEVEEWKA